MKTKILHSRFYMDIHPLTWDNVPTWKIAGLNERGNFYKLLYSFRGDKVVVLSKESAIGHWERQVISIDELLMEFVKR